MLNKLSFYIVLVVLFSGCLDLTPTSIYLTELEDGCLHILFAKLRDYPMGLGYVEIVDTENLEVIWKAESKPGKVVGASFTICQGVNSIDAKIFGDKEGVIFSSIENSDYFILDKEKVYQIRFKGIRSDSKLVTKTFRFD